jgi:hydroxyacylglutathione hydrolase
MPVVEKDSDILVHKIETAPYGTNAYILVCQATQDSVVIDAPAETEKIVASLKQTNPTQILITHSHFDHTGALRELKDRLKIPVGAHPDDADKLPLVPDFYLNEGDSVSFGKIDVEVIHTPGHTPGGLCFIYNRYLFSGDTLFPAGPGRTNSPTAFAQIVKSLKDNIFVLPDNTIIYPGHGASTTLKKEKDEFEVFSSRPHPPNLFGDVLWLAS